MEKIRFARTTFNAVTRLIEAVEDIATELERLNDNLEGVDADDVQEGE